MNYLFFFNKNFSSILEDSMKKITSTYIVKERCNEEPL